MKIEDISSDPNYLSHLCAQLRMFCASNQVMRGGKNTHMGLFWHIKNGNNPLSRPLGWRACDVLVDECVRLGYLVLEPLKNKLRLNPTYKIPSANDFQIMEKLAVDIYLSGVTNGRFSTSISTRDGVETMRKLVDFLGFLKNHKTAD
jgi:hypothetical protein